MNRTRWQFLMVILGLLAGVALLDSCLNGQELSAQAQKPEGESQVKRYLGAVQEFAQVQEPGDSTDVIAVDANSRPAKLTPAYHFAAWKPGTYTLTLTIGPDGELVSIEPASGGYDVHPAPKPSTSPTDPGDPDQPSLSAAVKSLAVLVGEPEIASLLAQGYATVAGQIEAGKFATKQDVVEAQNRVNQLLWFRSKDSGKWKAFADELSMMLTKRQAAGQLNDLEAMAKAWREIASGLSDAGTPNAAINVDLVIKLILAVLDRDDAEILRLLFQLWGER